MKLLSSTFLLIFILFSVVCFCQNNSINGVGVSTGLTGFYDFQSYGGAINYLEMNPTDTNRIHAIYMTAPDSTSPLSYRRTKCNFSSNGGTSWGIPVSVPSFRSGYPSLTLNPYFGYTATIASHALDTNFVGLVSQLFCEKSEGNLAFNDTGYTPSYLGDGSNEPYYPQVAATTNGNTVMLATLSSGGS